MQRISEKRLRKGSEFPGAHMARKKQNALSSRLRRREILKTVQQHGALDATFCVARKAGEFRAHPS